MIQISKKNKGKVLESIRAGRIDAADVSEPNIIDQIMLESHRSGIVQLLAHVVPDKRRANKSIPFKILWTLSVAAKMKQKMSVSSIPYAITDSTTLSELGYSIWDSDRDISKGLMDESAIRNMLGQYEKAELVEGYNRCVQQHIPPKKDIEANTHIVDCTKVDVPPNNAN